MRVSFDLDGVLFVPPATYETEDPLRFPLNRFYPNRLRKGSIKLIHTLQEEGFEVWVYTSFFPERVVYSQPFPSLRHTFRRHCQWIPASEGSTEDKSKATPGQTAELLSYLFAY